MKYVVLFGTFLLILSLILIQSSVSRSETPTTIESRDTVQNLYGKPVSEVYQTPQGLRVTAEFAPNGNLCRAHIRGGDFGITDAELNPVLDELAPKNARGEYKMGTFIDGMCLKVVKPENARSNSKEKLIVDPCAECSGVSEEYERVKITKYGNSNEYTSAHITFQRPECKELDKAQ